MMDKQTNVSPEFIKLIQEIKGNPNFCPTPEQSKIITASLSPLLVVAGAGSGKTETMAMRVLYLVAFENVRPEEILGLTFTRKAALELRIRVRQGLQKLYASEYWKRTFPTQEEGVLERGEPLITTYNSYAASLVRDYGYTIGLSGNTRLIGEAEASILMETVLAGAKVEEYPELVDQATSSTRKYARQISSDLGNHYYPDLPFQGGEDEIRNLNVCVGRQLEELIQELTDLEKEVKTESAGPLTDLKKARENLETRRAYLRLALELARQKKAENLIDFADQVAYATKIVKEHRSVVEGQRERFKAILLDEFQDTSVIQLELLSELFAGQAVTAVGDPLQAIYGWRGASSAALDTFTVSFRGEGAEAKDVEKLTLSTSWRNDCLILDVANKIASPLNPIISKEESSSLSSQRVVSPVLNPRPGAEKGRVLMGTCLNSAEESNVVATWFKAGLPGGTISADSPSMAVLCRKRSFISPMINACIDHELPYAVLGLGGLLEVPVIQDLLSALHIADDSADDLYLIRLLDKWRISPADINALRKRLKTIISESAEKSSAFAPQTLIDLINEIAAFPRREQYPELSTAAFERCKKLGKQIREIRSTVAQPLLERVWAAVRSLNLDIEVLAHPTDFLARRNLDLFIKQVHAFVESSDNPTLTQLLIWLETAREEERGFEQALEPVPGAVNILTVHAAKGLEWDKVAVVGLAETAFPTRSALTKEEKNTRIPKDPYTSSGWFSSKGDFPIPLRGDKQYLPQFSPYLYRGSEKKWFKEAMAQFQIEMGEYELNEERRLAYVAFTRARSELLLTTPTYRDYEGSTHIPSRFFLESAQIQGVETLQIGDEKYDYERIERLESTGEISADLNEIIYWPKYDSDNVIQAQEEVREVLAIGQQESADIISEILASSAPEDAALQQLITDVELLLKEKAAQEETQEIVIPLSRVSATGFEQLMNKTSEYAHRLRRPLPRVGNQSAALGSLFHAWAEKELRRESTLFVLEEPIYTQNLGKQEEKLLEKWKKTFHELELLDTHEPLELEADYYLELEGISIPCRIDAIFRQKTTQEVILVDWKTGKIPTSEEKRREYAIQLWIYQQAYAKRHLLEPDTVKSQLIFVGAGGKIITYQDLEPDKIFPHGIEQDVKNMLSKLKSL
ncbi:ATP-dependent helicase [Actinomycetaceae bacterium TAE3-ERU4]|nr:ATP-dependent helicase [Actinomycetaceae bacterium TAE3-ERU4]